MAENTDRPEAPAAEELLDFVPDRWLRHVPGRETFAWPMGDGPVLAVKRFGGGGVRAEHRRDLWYARLRGQARRSPGQAEFDNLAALSADGFSVPEPVGWAEDRARGLSVVLMRWIPHRETLRDRLGHPGRGAERRELLLELAGFAARLHRAGYYHRDLYVHHFVLAVGSAEPQLTLLDLGRVRRERAPRARWLIKDLGALAHSLPALVTAPEREAFFQSYFDLAGPDTLAARARWLRAIERRRRRIAAHVPRHSGEVPES
ncbi:MAG: tRNA A-37 threonylcarbamoyl transferase component Bud32 [Chlamydiales bacterium]|jgi:tRNA A-37 threonylcarbamoyl transferase component Bud32